MSLVSSVEDKVEIADRSISTIITLSLSGDEEVEKQAVCTLANLVEMVELHDKILEEDGLAPLIALATANDMNTKAEASRVLANLAANRDIQQSIISQGGLRPLVDGGATTDGMPTFWCTGHWQSSNKRGKPGQNCPRG